MGQSNIDHSTAAQVNVDKISVPVEGIVNKLCEVREEIVKSHGKPPVIVELTREPVKIDVNPKLPDVNVAVDLHQKVFYFATIPVGGYYLWALAKDIYVFFSSL